MALSYFLFSGIQNGQIRNLRKGVATLLCGVKSGRLVCICQHSLKLKMMKSKGGRFQNEKWLIGDLQGLVRIYANTKTPRAFIL